jgi:uncharacterized protein YukE
MHICAARLRAESEALHLQAQSLVSAAGSVEWYGASRDTFQYEMEQISAAMARLADECDMLAMRVQREENEWEQTDSYFVEQFSQIIILNII